MKRFHIDTNFHWYGPHKPSIMSDVLGMSPPKPGERVVVYQEEDEWDAVVCHDLMLPEGHQWYVELTSTARQNLEWTGR